MKSVSFNYLEKIGNLQSQKSTLSSFSLIRQSSEDYVSTAIYFRHGFKEANYITSCTNIVEAYNGFSKWLFFGKDGLITDNEPLEQERLKYLDLVANSIILQNAFDISSIIRFLSAEGYVIKPRTLATLSPYLTGHLKRYGDYIVDFDNLPQPLETAMVITIEPETQ